MDNHFTHKEETELHHLKVLILLCKEVAPSPLMNLPLHLANFEFSLDMFSSNPCTGQ